MPSSEKIPFSDKLFSFLKREAKDAKEGLDKLGQTMDAELAEREKKLKASPAERIDMLQDEMSATKSRFDEIERDVAGTAATASAQASTSATAGGSIEDRREAASATPQLDTEAESPVIAPVEIEDPDPKEPDPKEPDPEEPDPEEPAGDVAELPADEAGPAPAATPVEPPNHHLQTDLLAEHAVMKERADATLDELRGELGLDP